MPLKKCLAQCLAHRNHSTNYGYYFDCQALNHSGFGFSFSGDGTGHRWSRGGCQLRQSPVSSRNQLSIAKQTKGTVHATRRGRRSASLSTRPSPQTPRAGLNRCRTPSHSPLRLALGRIGGQGKTPELTGSSPPSPAPTTPLPAGAPPPTMATPLQALSRLQAPPPARPTASRALRSFSPRAATSSPDALRSPTGLAGRGRRDGGKMAAEAGYWRRLPQSRSRRR